MRTIVPSLLVFGLMIVAGMPSAVATHGDTAYLIGMDGLFFSESAYVTGPGYTNQFWDFFVVSAAGNDFCPLVNGGWDPDIRVNPPLPGGFSGVCDSGTNFAVTGIDHYHPYPNPGNGCAPVPACGGMDIHEVTVTYGDSVIQAQLVVCDNNRNAVLNRVTTSYCTDFQMFT